MRHRYGFHQSSGVVAAELRKVNPAILRPEQAVSSERLFIRTASVL